MQPLQGTFQRDREFSVISVQTTGLMTEVVIEPSKRRRASKCVCLVMKGAIPKRDAYYDCRNIDLILLIEFHLSDRWSSIISPSSVQLPLIK